MVEMGTPSLSAITPEFVRAPSRIRAPGGG
jgi:hypothetical protein